MAPTHRTLIALLIVCAALAVNGLVLGPVWLAVPGEFSDTVATPAFGISQRVSWGLLTVLVVLAPAVLLAGRRPAAAWVAPLVQVAIAAQAATHFVQGFVLPWLETVAPEVLDLTAGGTLQLALTAIWVLFVVVGLIFAVVLWRVGHSRTGAVLMAVGAAIIPGAGPVGAGVLGIGLGLVALQALRAGSERPAVALTPAVVP